MAEGIQMKNRVLTLRSAHGYLLSIARQILNRPMQSLNAIFLYFPRLPADL